MTNLNEIKKELDFIKSRNKRVETDKAWETSWTRKIIITITTYVLIVIFMYIAKLEKPIIGAIIPSVAYLLSVSSMTLIKKVWINKYNEK